MDYSDEIAILTLPHSNDLASISYHTNNCLVLIAITGQLFLLTGLLLVTILVPYLIREEEAGGGLALHLGDSSNVTVSKLGSAYLYVILTHLVVYWVVSLLRFLLHRFHYRKLRIIGYHNHYRSTVWLNKATSWIFHRINGLILLATTLLCHYLEDQGIIHVGLGGWDAKIRSVNVLQSLIIFALALIFPILFKFLYHEIRFRRDRNPPDIFCLDNPANLQQAGLGEIGIRSTSYLEDLLEKQADLIYNLKLQNSHLRWTLHKVSQRQANGGGVGGDQTEE